MAKLLLVYVISVILALAYSCSATNYLVGDNSGWDISTDLDTWLSGKRFIVGDVLLFQFSNYHSVYEVTKENFDRCNTTNALKSSSKGNTTFPLTKPGDSYFICGNRLHCLGGMKLDVNVEDNGVASPAAAPAPAPQARVSFPTPSASKRNNNPSAIVPSSITNVSNHVGLSSLLLVNLGILSLLFWFM
ncbi:mavicyanin-like [Nicotiana tabacum]|uniref:Mavicyanin-like n=2 Tax=Nicotiana TaxID=4085 RepID=A0A1S3YSM8_TOBAC|nr:PREDICTED: mavicyanin-like [Nicotiana sylvestris]XP_016455229.1 PREDICTED: mavicyanin-like [Nicotiana tabacum]